MIRIFTIVMAEGRPRGSEVALNEGMPRRSSSPPATVVQQAFSLSRAEDIMVVTGRASLAATRSRWARLSERQILVEPLAHKTAPRVGWALTRAIRQDADAVCAVLPAEPLLETLSDLTDAVRKAAEAAVRGAIVAVGVPPDSADVGYGYLEVGQDEGDGIFRARRFVEKPNRQRAEQFLAAGGFLWNTGILVFRAAVMLEVMRQHLPALGSALNELLEQPVEAERETLNRVYPAMPPVSVSHGILEKLDNVRVVPGALEGPAGAAG